MWVDIFPADDVPLAIDISPPPPQKWELRVIVWSGKNLPDDVDDSGLADWCARAAPPFTAGAFTAHSVECWRSRQC
eukprot:5376870-Prymnesium_polylepis.1